MHNAHHGVAHEQTGQAGVLPLHILHMSNDILNIGVKGFHMYPITFTLAMADWRTSREREREVGREIGREGGREVGREIGREGGREGEGEGEGKGERQYLYPGKPDLKEVKIQFPGKYTLLISQQL